jgi:hypothetical protein
MLASLVKGKKKQNIEKKVNKNEKKCKHQLFSTILLFIALAKT